MAQKAPGKAHRIGLSLVEVMDMFPDEDAAREWIESIVWPDGRCCGKCGSTNTRPTRRCPTGVRTAGATSGKGTPLAASNTRCASGRSRSTSGLKSVSSMKLHRDLLAEVRMVHAPPIREAWMPKSSGGPVDETYMGGKRKNMSNAKRKALEGTGRGAVVVGAKGPGHQAGCRPRGDGHHEANAPGRIEHTAPGATVYTAKPRHMKSDTTYMDNLRAVGLTCEDIDIVMCTHLHLDHVGWNTRLADGRWVPTFPNAEYLMSGKELEAFRWVDQPVSFPSMVDSVLPVALGGRIGGSDRLLPASANLETRAQTGTWR